MLTGNLVRVRSAKERIIPIYLNRSNADWLEVAESLLMVFREHIGRTRGEIEEEIDEMLGEGLATLAHRGLAKVLEDRAEFEVVAEISPETVREEVFSAAAEYRRGLRAAGHRAPFHAEVVLERVSQKIGMTSEQISLALFADLRDENRLLSFKEMTAQQLVDRYNVALAQAVLLRSVRMRVEIRGEKPAGYRQVFRKLKFHRLLHKVEGDSKEGYVFQIDGPLSLFNSTNKYGMQMASFLPTLLLRRDFRIDAELLWGPRKEPRTFYLGSEDGLVSHQADEGTYVPAEIGAFVDRFRQVAASWDVSEEVDIIELGREGAWVPDFRFVHRASGIEVYVEVVGFWKKHTLERLLRLLPKYGPERYVLAISDRLKVDEGAAGELDGPILRFKEIPNAVELLAMLNGFITGRSAVLPIS